MIAHANRINDQFQGAMERPAELVREYPLASMMLMFGMGLGVGVVVSTTLCNSLMDESSMSKMTDKLRRQVYDALSNVLSPSMLHQLRSYTS